MSNAKASTAHLIFAVLKKLANDTNEKELEMIDMATSVCDSVKDVTSSTVEKARVAAIKVNKSAHVHPWHYVGAAALIGFVSGLIIRR